MKSKDNYKNKFFLGALIIIIILGSDILLHKGMVRTLIPYTFIKNQAPADFLRCDQPLVSHSKDWAKAIDSVIAIENLDQKQVFLYQAFPLPLQSSSRTRQYLSYCLQNFRW